MRSEEGKIAVAETWKESFQGYFGAKSTMQEAYNIIVYV